jgi:mannan endo-1,4-beta-mannosidase
VKPGYGETYTFSTLSDDGIRVWVDGKMLIDNWTGHGDTWNSGRAVLEAGTLYPIKVEFFQGGGAATLQLCWESTSQKKEVVPATALFVDADGLATGLSATYYRGTDLKR